MSEIDIARIGADATIIAALIQGGLTCLAGIIALIGGFLAYRGAVRAASIGVRLEEKKYDARVAAYQYRIGLEVRRLELSLKVCSGEATITLDRFRSDGASRPMPELQLYDVPEFSDRNWEDHALLGQAAVQAISKINHLLDKYISFQREVIKEKLMTDSIPSCARAMGPPQKHLDGSLSMSLAKAVEENEALAKEALAAVGELKSSIT